MSRVLFLQGISLNKGAIKWEEGLQGWVANWMGSDWTEDLIPEGWFDDAHQPRFHAWTTPPVVAFNAIKELALSKMNHPDQVMHILTCPQLIYN